MPELPEVEAFRRYLVDKIVKKQIVDVNVYYPKLIKKPSVKEFVNTTLQQKIEKIRRHGKYLLIFLSRNVLIVHFRMEGRFFVSHYPEEKQLKHLLVRFQLDSKEFLDYQDSRRFGTFHLESYASYKNNPGLKKLGVEPFDEKLTSTYLKTRWTNRQIKIKVALLEQDVIAGIGNIYACELLFACKIAPNEPVNNLTMDQLRNLIHHLRKIMKKAIQLNGTTAHTFHVDGKKGEYWKMLKVYGRKGKKCLNCSAKIEFIKINQRGTFYCPNCQKKIISVKLF